MLFKTIEKKVLDKGYSRAIIRDSHIVYRKEGKEIIVIPRHRKVSDDICKLILKSLKL